MEARASDREAIIALCDRLGDAQDAQDITGILACYAPDARIFDLATPLETRGLDGGAIAAWHDTWIASPRFDARDVEITVEGTLAIMVGLHRIRGTKTDGQDVDMWFRVTTCLRKIDGAWLIVHDHSSVPFHMDGSDRAAIDLTPQGDSQAT
ncbi:MAG: YybH family protein [Alphaproteobacteria bacterium]